MVPNLRIYLVRSVHLHRSSYYHHGHHCFLEFDQGILLNRRHQDDDSYLLRSFHRCCCWFDLHHQDNTEHIRLRCKTKIKNYFYKVYQILFIHIYRNQIYQILFSMYIFHVWLNIWLFWKKIYSSCITDCIRLLNGISIKKKDFANLS